VILVQIILAHFNFIKKLRTINLDQTEARDDQSHSIHLKAKHEVFRALNYMLGQSEINFRQFGTHFGGNRLPSNDIEAGFHPFRSQELIQEVTLKLQPEST
jgi:hypothetical protein